MKLSSSHWPFQEPKLEVPTIYTAYFSGLSFQSSQKLLVPPGENAWRARAGTFLDACCTGQSMGVYNIIYIYNYLYMYGIIWDIISAHLLWDMLFLHLRLPPASGPISIVS